MAVTVLTLRSDLVLYEHYSTDCHAILVRYGSLLRLTVDVSVWWVFPVSASLGFWVATGCVQKHCGVTGWEDDILGNDCQLTVIQNLITSWVVDSTILPLLFWQHLLLTLGVYFCVVMATESSLHPRDGLFARLCDIISLLRCQIHMSTSIQIRHCTSDNFTRPSRVLLLLVGGLGTS